jgi:rubredoxin
MAVYKCTICGHEYNPELGEPGLNIPPGIPFENLPDDWQCPICCATKDEFRKL